MYYWMAVEPDLYELPIALADTAKELARMLGESSASTIINRKRMKNSGRRCGYKVITVKRTK